MILYWGRGEEGWRGEVWEGPNLTLCSVLSDFYEYSEDMFLIELHKSAKYVVTL